MSLFLISLLLLPSTTLSLSLSTERNNQQLNSISKSIEPITTSSSTSKTTTTIPTRPLKGRFLHLTDLHPDPHYKYGTDIDTGVCHRKIKSLEEAEENVSIGSNSVVRGKGKAGYWGEPDSVCDAPVTLVNSTFNWLSKHLTSPSTITSPSNSSIARKEMEIDFIVWSGDNSRHDLDPELPRKLDEIYDLNRYVAGRMKEYVDNGVTVVTCFGNNDVFPHNTMYTGPSSLTKQFSEIWSDFIPKSQMSNFIAGGYYSIEAIPSKLLLISLNTMYMYDANKVVKGCPAFDSSQARKRKIDPGTQELIWLEKELGRARDLGMQVWLVGHVSPSLDNWYEGCYVNYGEIVLRYHDTILGQLFGHMNTDHFSYYQADDIYLSEHPSSSTNSRKSHRSFYSNSPIKSYSMEADLKSTYSKIPRKSERDLGDYSIINVNPSVIPTYLPSLRIWQYNITEVEDGFKQVNEDSVQSREVNIYEEEDIEEGEIDADEDDLLPMVISSKSSVFSYLSTTFATQKILSIFSLATSTESTLLTSAAAKKRHKKKKPHLPRHSSPSSPSQFNTFLSPVGYTQFYLDLNSANKNSGYGPGQKGRDLLTERGEKGVRDEPEWSIEYTTFEADKFGRELLGIGSQLVGIPLSLIPSEIQIVLSGETEEKEKVIDTVVGLLEDLEIVPYEMADLTVGSWLKLARDLSRNKRDWKDYVKRMTMGV